MDNATISRRARVSEAINAYSRAVQKPVNQELLVDMVCDVLWYGRQINIAPAIVCEQVMNDDTGKDAVR